MVETHEKECENFSCTDVGTAKAVIVTGCPCIGARLLVGLLACIPAVDAASRRRRFQDCNEGRADEQGSFAGAELCVFVVAALLSAVRSSWALAVAIRVERQRKA